jgi:hypothetical protein
MKTIEFKSPTQSPIFKTEEWVYNDVVAEPPEGAIGFVYCIHNLETGRRYFGKKLCRFSRTKQVTVTLKNGTKKKKKQKVYKESDWREYYGSNDYLVKDVESLGKNMFYREVLEWCYSTGEMTYIEGWYQMRYQVLLYPDDFYNGWISMRSSGTHIKRLREMVGGKIGSRET